MNQNQFKIYVEDSNNPTSGPHWIECHRDWDFESALEKKFKSVGASKYELDQAVRLHYLNEATRTAKNWHARSLGYSSFYDFLLCTGADLKSVQTHVHDNASEH